MIAIELSQRPIQPFPTGSLWALIQHRTRLALQRGAIQPIPTEYEFIADQGVTFVIRIMASLVRKEAAHKQHTQNDHGLDRGDPFLPYDPDLFVADATETHVCLLNKFNVLDHHILIVTREYEDQETSLTYRDFEALGRCMAEFDGLGFYNAGPVAGASQRHKHLQMVPLPLAPRGPKIPIEPALHAAVYRGPYGRTPWLPFRHVVSRLAPLDQGPLSERVSEMQACYRAMLQEAGVTRASDEERLGPYNLLVTREWMYLVPRSQECFQGISVNGLGFAGALLVKDRQQVDIVRRYGPMTILREVGVSSAC